MDLPPVITPELISYIRETYQLNWDGIHGWNHWVRVWENGQRLASLNGADQTIVALFAFTHDMARQSDGWDLAHGPRAAKRIQSELQGRLIQLSPGDLQLLLKAVADHTRGFTKADITVQTCWDADRLDIGRVHITPSPDRLCTLQAKDPEILRWAIERSQSRH